MQCNYKRNTTTEQKYLKNEKEISEGHQWTTYFESSKKKKCTTE